MVSDMTITWHVTYQFFDGDHVHVATNGCVTLLLTKGLIGSNFQHIGFNWFK